ncbi:S8 family serine peptidase [Allokutzneria sp. A3M-2-11 16]|uniref:S8 family peptidase n=1 Tax=Allokutzneria sp. A3M-2-11 16 TaxID=2962043 RepID=UPI0020B891E0|nr:S8 family serine peptidase [Allokutzneria sp. A3M-2-11 16]MCP3803488.1 S8 family serine peptidase [Allokutzneria sp. A3M-2-11 16]
MRFTALGAALVLGATLLSTATARAGQEPPPLTGPVRWVTLVTGDRVGVAPGTIAASTITPAPGRERMRFSTQQIDGRLRVVPEDAADLLARGVLDERLFDVTTLIESGLDDSASTDLPLIISQPRDRFRDAPGARVTADLPSLRAAAVTADKRQAPQLWTRLTASGVDRLWLDGVRKATLDRSTAQVGAPTAWQAGLTGAGVKVAVLDTGVDQTHPDLADRELAERNFTDEADAVDRNGHGTHVASTIAGTGVKSGGAYRGVAPGARILDAKVLNRAGSGRDSWLLAGMQWAVEQGAKVVNLSLGTRDTPGTDPVEQAVATLTAEHGALFVVAAGNSGPDARTLDSPGTVEAALTVGAVERDEKVYARSSRGPAPFDGAIKPDITAPGVGIAAAKAAHGTIGTPGADGYVALTGTSMATPHVAGAAALLAQRNPGWKADELKSTLTGSATPNPALGLFDQGSGRLDIAKALTQTVTTTPSNLGFGVQRWPHDDDKAVTKPVVYRNPGAVPVTVDLRVEATGPNGKPTPQGMFTLDRSTVTVPARGEVTVQVTANTAIPGADGQYTGRLIATSTATTVSVPLAVDKEVESYDVTIDHIDRAGASAPAFTDTIVNSTAERWQATGRPDGKSTFRLPKGRYSAWSEVKSDDDMSLHLNPALEVAGATTVTVDARRAKPIVVGLPNAAARSKGVDVGFTRHIGQEHHFVASVFRDDFSGIYTEQTGPAIGAEELIGKVAGHWAEPGPDGGFATSPRTYHLAWYEHGGISTGLQRQVRDSDLAAVHADHASTSNARLGQKNVFSLPVRGECPVYMPPLEVSLPSRRTEYYLAEGNRWYATLTRPDLRDPEMSLESTPTRYRPGESRQQRWNGAVVSPGLPSLIRDGDRLAVHAPLFTDGAGHRGGPTASDRGTTTVYRDGTKLAEVPRPGAGDFTLPPQEAEYRVDTEVTRPATTLSTKVSASWTFRSGHTGEQVVLPALAVRFAPKTDEFNRAPAATRFTIPVIVDHTPGSPAGQLRDLAVDVSYDDGKTWQRAQLGNDQSAEVNHPAGPGFVSLRVKATAADGTTFEQTTLRAYALTS